VRYLPAHEDDGWITTTFYQQGNKGISWARRTGNRIWCLFGRTVNNPAAYDYVKPLLTAMRNSWRAAALPVPLRKPASVTGPAGGVRALIGSAAGRLLVLWGALALAALALLVLRRRRGDRLAPMLLYVLVAGLWIALTLAGRAWPLLRGLSLSLALGGVEALAGCATLGCVAALALRARSDSGRPPGARPSVRKWPVDGALASLLVLTVSLLAVWGLASLYGTAASVGSTRAVWQGLIVILALLWELIFAGELLNPGDPGSLLPSRARLLMYAGYLLLTASAVLLLGTLRTIHGGARVGLLDSETVVQVGIVELGIPLAITLFVLSWVRQGRPATPQG
jgi:hypothetical protein